MQITDEMVEKAAKALCEARLWAGASAWALANEVEKENLIFEARAALEAVAPPIAKAGVDDLLAFLDEKYPTIADDVRFALALRDKATPTPSTPQEK